MPRNALLTIRINSQYKDTQDVVHRMQEECRSALGIAEKKQLSAF